MNSSNDKKQSDFDADTTAGEEDIDRLPGDVSEEIFFDLADSFIELANSHTEKLPVESISSALMYAASRYNAFLAVNEAGEGTLEPETSVDFYTLQYRKMFEDNLAELIGHEIGQNNATDGNSQAASNGTSGEDDKADAQPG